MTTEKKRRVLKPGTVKFYNRNGWGIIIPDEGGPDVFFHIKAFDRHRDEPGHGQGPEPVQGQRVVYQDAENDKGLYALRAYPAAEVEDFCPKCGRWFE